MKALAYKGTSPGLAGLMDRGIRFRLKGPYSHNEIMFEPGDNVEHYMPDQKLDPVDGSFWMASSSGIDRIPAYSPRRNGMLGGVRFKRIVPSPDKWDMVDLNTIVPGTGMRYFDPEITAKWFFDNQGMCYDYKLIAHFLSWIINDDKDKMVCYEAVAQSLGFDDPWRYDTVMLPQMLLDLNEGMLRKVAKML